jgi:hypothetical protein
VALGRDRRAPAGQDLNAATAAKVDQYVAAVETFSASSTVILAPADELAAGTIDKTLAKHFASPRSGASTSSAPAESRY